MTAPPIKQFEGASLISTDIEATLHFWVDFVGGEVVGAGSADGRVPWRVALGGVVLDFYQATDAQQPSPGTNGQHYCWDCEPTDFDFWVDRGLAWAMRPKHIAVHANGKELSLYWDDPDGYHFEIAAHYCTNVELMKARAVRTKRFNQLNALPDLPFTNETRPATAADSGAISTDKEVTVATTPIGLINHFTNISPDVETTKHFYIDFLGGTWYSENFRLHQVALGGVLIDCFPPGEESSAPPEPGSERQQYRYSIDPTVVGEWIEHADSWRVRTTMLVEPSLRRLLLKFDTPNGYHIALGATYPSAEALDEAVEEYGEHVARLSTITEPFTMDSGPKNATSVGRA